MLLGLKLLNENMQIYIAISTRLWACYQSAVRGWLGEFEGPQ